MNKVLAVVVVLASLLWVSECWTVQRQGAADSSDLDLCSSTGSACINTCPSTDGLYQSCVNCSCYMSCQNQVALLMTCQGDLVWDDEVKECLIHSSTCLECEEFADEVRARDVFTDEMTTDMMETTDNLETDITDPSQSTSVTSSPTSSTTSGGSLPEYCGSMLQWLSDQGRVEPGWTALCYIMDDDENAGSNCTDLLQDLAFGYSGAQELLEAGGNFGCLLHTVHPDDENSAPERGCKDDYQHHIVIDKKLCPMCIAMSVCLRYP